MSSKVMAIIDAAAIEHIFNLSDNYLRSKLIAGFEGGTLKFYSGERDLIFDDEDSEIFSRLLPYKQSAVVRRSQTIRQGARVLANNLDPSELPSDQNSLEIVSACVANSGAVLISSELLPGSISRDDLCKKSGVQCFSPEKYFSTQADDEL